MHFWGHGPFILGKRPLDQYKESPPGSSVSSSTVLEAAMARIEMLEQRLFENDEEKKQRQQAEQRQKDLANKEKEQKEKDLAKEKEQKEQDEAKKAKEQKEQDEANKAKEQRKKDEDNKAKQRELQQDCVALSGIKFSQKTPGLISMQGKENIVPQPPPATPPASAPSKTPADGLDLDDESESCEPESFLTTADGKEALDSQTSMFLFLFLWPLVRPTFVSCHDGFKKRMPPDNIRPFTH